MIYASKPTLTYLAASLAIFLCLSAAATTSREARPVYCEADGKISASEVPYFVDILFDPELTFEDLCYAEVMLATGPLKEVCTALLPLVELRYSEERPCLNASRSPGGFALCPYPWPSVYAAWRVFRGLFDRSAGPLSAQFAREFLPDARFRLLRPYLIHYLEEEWNEESEKMACDLFEDSSSGYETRRAAATVLFHQNPWKYYEPFIQVCLTEHGDLKAALVQLLVYESHKLKLGIDERLIRLSIEVIEADYYRPSNNLRIAYTLAYSLSSYLGADLKLNVVSESRALTVAQANDRIRRHIHASLDQARKVLLDLEDRYKSEQVP